MKEAGSQRRLAKPSEEDVARYADMLAAMGTEPRLRIVRLLLSAHPQGMVVGEIGEELDISPSTLSHHLEKLKHEELVSVRREGTYLWCSEYQRNRGSARFSVCRV